MIDTPPEFNPVGWENNGTTPIVYPELYDDEPGANGRTELDFFREWCSLVYDWDQIRFGAPIEMMTSFIALYKDCPEACFHLMELVSTNFERKKMSYSQIGDTKLTSKQNVEQLETKWNSFILKHFPYMADTLDPNSKVVGKQGDR